MIGSRGVLAVRRGRAPNCSATGSVVGLALLSAAATAAVVNLFADRFWTWVERPDGQEPPKIRRERRGSVLAWASPPALLRLDEAATRAALAAGAVPIGANHPDLPAPLEVHVAVTATCPVACTDCYLDAGPHRDASPPDVERQLEELAAMGVFEVALGGGELLAADPERLFALAERCRALGLVPNLTTSGFGMRPVLAARLAGVMGQVNVSLDGIGADYRARRGFDGTRVALAAIDHLVAAGVRVGVNTVLGRGSVEGLAALGELLAARGAAEWQWLRLKPAGRARHGYPDRALTPDEAMALWPALLAIEANTGLVMRVDCALVPFLVAHGPPVESLRAMSVVGCAAGRDLWSIGVDGAAAPCSFAHDLAAPSAASLADRWLADPTLGAWRARAAAPPEPCASCAYRDVCRGGCRVVSGFLTGDPLAPDPECPRVRAWC